MRALHKNRVLACYDKVKWQSTGADSRTRAVGRQSTGADTGRVGRQSTGADTGPRDTGHGPSEEAGVGLPGQSTGADRAV